MTLNASQEVYSPPAAGSERVNNFTITFCTINGSGSATANNVLLRALFKMGIPVSGKNIFPSNIQGLPTWYTIRCSNVGFLARVEDDDITVAMNPASFAKDIAYTSPGGVLFYADDIRLPITRTDITVYPMPVKKLAKEANVPSSLRDYIANMVYVGVLSQMLGIKLEVINEVLDYHFKGKRKAIDSNAAVITAAAQWAAANLVKKDPFHVEPMQATDGFIMADGNTAGALGAIFGGVQFAGWYPITPASSLAESLNEYLPELRKDPATGKNTFVVVQAEDELAAIGMSVGAGWAGLRSMTSTSGPGFSLMTEYAGLAYFTEVPLVIWDVQRVGPSTGLPTRTAQGDLTMANFLGHGDTQYVILIPGSVNECFEFGWKAFDLAERLQTPVIVLSDLDLGMNQWMTRPFDYPDKPMDRGKILWEGDLEKLQGQWARYLDVDGDGIPYRTVVGNQHGRSAYFTRGTGHDENARYSEEPDVWEKLMQRLAKKMETARTMVPKPVIENDEEAEIGIISMGSADPAIEEARSMLADAGIKSDYMRIRALPFSSEVLEFIRKHTHNYVVELNRDGQLNQLLILAAPEESTRLISTAHSDGMPLSARWVYQRIQTLKEAKS
jgi:2-oxoglutarate/2-oxoacid ferredoxin oxidoreductase subunit alpha